MTFQEAMKINREELRRQWEFRKGDLLEALTKLKQSITEVEKQVDQPIPDCGLYEMYLGMGTKMEIDFEKALRAYEGLESVKFRAKFIQDLTKAVES